MGQPRESTRQVMVGNVPIGGGAPVAVQSMTNVPMGLTVDGSALDVKGNLRQISQLAEAGCEIVRVAIPNLTSLDEFSQICAESPIPVIADVHFDYRIATGACTGGAAGVRINPGNIGSPDSVDAVIEAAGEAGIPIRIGVNAGSLDTFWRERVDLPVSERLARSAISFFEYFVKRDFHDVVISTKAHDVITCVEAYRLLAREIPEVPLHLGVTEAGTIMPGTVKSAVGLGILLSEGIGDTFRVSLTDDPVREVEVGWEILGTLGMRRRTPELVSCPTCSRCQVDLIGIAKEVERRLRKVDKPIRVAVMGCVVNGPGEARDADVGVACGPDNGVVFAHGDSVCKVPQDEIVDALFDEIAKL